MANLIRCDYCHREVTEDVSVDEMQQIDIDLAGQGSEEGSIVTSRTIHVCEQDCLAEWDEHLAAFGLIKNES